jgi:hypothetical protein
MFARRLTVMAKIVMTRRNEDVAQSRHDSLS